MFFSDLSPAPLDPIFDLFETCRKDLRPEKINLLVGLYKNEELKTELMPTVLAAKRQLIDRDPLYLPMDGSKLFVEEIGSLLFGKKQWNKERELIYGGQALGGTGALRLGADFLFNIPIREISIPSLTWGNHIPLFETVGFKIVRSPHEFDPFIAHLRKLSKGTVVLLHAVCQNPTGLDPTLEEWREISKVIKKQKLIPFFDCAYHGFGQGLEEDASSIRLFLEDGHEMLVAYSCSKNFSLYNQRVGVLFVISQKEKTKEMIATRIRRSARTCYSNPPAHGALLAAHILQTPSLRNSWQEELNGMRQRLLSIRSSLAKRIPHVGRGKGMFCLLSLSKEQIRTLREKYAIYLLENGRIDISGLNHHNLDRAVDCYEKVF